MKVVLFSLLVGLVAIEAVPTCKQILKEVDLSDNFNETIAHAIHSLTVQALRQFHPRATENNNIPTVNPRLNVEKTKVLPYAPSEESSTDFAGDAMNTIDTILSTLGSNSDGLGPNWSPVERIAHKFHMKDLWAKVFTYFKQLDTVDSRLCHCLTDTASNGIHKAVEWIAQHYEHGTPITLLNRPIPKLVDASSWTVWKNRLLHYYTPTALQDAALFMKCAVKQFD